MYYGKVEICGVNTAKLPVLTEKEKTALLRAARAGDKEARQRIMDITVDNVKAYLNGAPINVVNK